ncbi:MAG TPA: antibiotic biosynthesis monooxygenase [Stellaceae bacterium]|nr:antibiotic biosynthesis monooxygenase [Stellaceae bacterium]
MRPVTVVHYRCRAERERELEAIFETLACETRQEAGCIAYQFHRDPDEPGRYLLYECYVDEAALKAHQAAAYFETLVKGAIPALIEERRIERFVTLDPAA